MAATSSLVPLGTPAPHFTLPGIDGANYSLRDFGGADVLAVAFLCNHCPYVQHIEQALGEFRPGTWPSGNATFALVGICSNDVEQYPDDDVDQLKLQVERAGWFFPYLIDTEQTAARAYGAVCTPDFFVYGRERTLVYRGAFDDSTPGNNRPVTGNALRNAIDLVAQGKRVPEPHKPSMGCSIKWKPDAA